MQLHGPCAEKTRLLLKYDFWMDKYLTCALALRSRSSRVKSRAQRAIESAHAKLERARLDLYWHVARHGC